MLANKALMAMLLVCALPVLGSSTDFGDAHSSSPVSLPTKIAVALFKGDSLDSLARSLRPLNFTVNTTPFTQLRLRDAIYVGAEGGQAKLTSVWITQTDNDDTPILSAN